MKKSKILCIRKCNNGFVTSDYDAPGFDFVAHTYEELMNIVKDHFSEPVQTNEKA